MNRSNIVFTRRPKADTAGAAKNHPTRKMRLRM